MRWKWLTSLCLCLGAGEGSGHSQWTPSVRLPQGRPRTCGQFKCPASSFGHTSWWLIIQVCRLITSVLCVSVGDATFHVDHIIHWCHLVSEMGINAQWQLTLYCVYQNMTAVQCEIILLNTANLWSQIICESNYTYSRKYINIYSYLLDEQVSQSWVLLV